MFGVFVVLLIGDVKGCGVLLNNFIFGFFVFLGVWDWYFYWRECCCGFYIRWEDDMMVVLLGMVCVDIGWMW